MGELVCVPPDKIGEMWPHVEGYIKDAVDKCGDWTVEGVRAAIDQDRMLLWATWDGERIGAVATTAMELVPRGKVCRAITCAGNDPDWPSLISRLEKYASGQGCIAMRVHGRPGWARVFRDYKTEWVALEKRLD